MSRDSPVVQGNCILALSGLAAALAKYESNLPTDVEGSLQVNTVPMCWMSCSVSLMGRIPWTAEALVLIETIGI